ncbi:uncharacterized protein LOC131637497 [Vicia villosa]|uniref:uncharacterized protein LOC131637497 n=1 Tax=Vicia villosa TaxID=3911 RepID=UPI00273BE046|nr:uncharacterized protein LOC131637497 [Vicia villosa]
MDWQSKNCSWILASVFKCRDRIKGTNTWGSALTNGKYNTVEIYNDLRGNREHVTWKYVLHRNFAKPLAKFILWLSLLDRLSIKDRLLKHGSNVDAGCIFCRDMETLHHLFFECQTTNLIWRSVLHHIGYNRNPRGWSQEKIWLNSETRKKGWHRDLLKIAIAECVYGIWRHRNGVIFSQTRGSLYLEGNSS